MGDPAGIGPDITLFAWLRRNVDRIPAFFVVGDPTVFVDRAGLLDDGGSVFIQEIENPEQACDAFSNALPVLPLTRPLGPVPAGSPDSARADAIIESIEKAVALTAAGRAAAIVTNPIAKYVLLESGFAHAGHTDFLAELATRHGSAGATPVMMMASKRLKAVPVTVHIALRDVSSAITKDRIITVASITSRAFLHSFGIPEPRLAVCGLNPHAGENGALGREEIEVIAPAIEALNAQGIHATGPHSADALFHDAAREQYDAVLAMYHDQALIPFKTLSFADGVNVTLGLPFIRTSPDHGTAFSLAGTGHADPSSFIEALRLAARMSSNSAAAPWSVSHP
jgi:4-hydroxythreonine-4-phosphate dehydrogenase